MEFEVAAAAEKIEARRSAGGAATGGGMNFQAAVTAICLVRMARGSALGWLEGLIHDVPIAVTAETNGPGDDIRVDLVGGEVAEIQVKRGLKKGQDLWDAVSNLADGLSKGDIAFGVLAVCPNSSQTLRRFLARDIRRLGDGLTEGMSAIGLELVAKLEVAGIDPQNICCRLRLVTVSALSGADAASIDAAKADLGQLCERRDQIDNAWLALEADADALIERRGRRDLTSLVRCLRARQIALKADTFAGPVILLERVTHWNFEAHTTFSIIGCRKPLQIDHDWLALVAVVRTTPADPAMDGEFSLADALKAYHGWERLSRDRDSQTVNPETLGRFIKRVVVVAGPGLGKSTMLKRIVRRYSEDGVPVLRVRLATVAASMRAGMTFEEAVFRHGLDGSGLSVEEVRRAGWSNWLLLGDGLDECGDLQHEVADGVERFAKGYPDSRILVTTRPVGYRAGHFSEWRHYDLVPLEPSEAPRHVASLLAALSDGREEAKWSKLVAEQLKNKEICEIVGRTPLLLGMAAAVLASGQTLGTTRETLFEQIFALVDDIPRRSVSKPAPEAVLNRSLDILAWHLTGQPLLPCPEVERLCATDLAAETGDPFLRAISIVQAAIAYWEDTGLIERVGAGTIRVYGFIHKSLGEFAAARHLCWLQGLSQQQALQQCMSDSAWNEVLRFAGLRGPAEEIAAQIAGLPKSSPDLAEKLAYGARLLAEVPDRISAHTRERLLASVFDLIGDNREPKASRLGKSLIVIARHFPEDVAPQAAGIRHAPPVWARLVAWNCLVAAGPKFYDVDDLIDAIEPAISAGCIGMETSLGGGMVLRGGEAGDLTSELAIAAALAIVARCERSDAEAVISKIFNLIARHNYDFAKRARELIGREGWNVSIEHERNTFMGFDLGDDWDKAQLRGDQFVLDALAGDEVEEAEFDDFTRLLNLSAFVQMSNMSEVPASDVWAWSRLFDPAPATHVLQVFAAISGIDPVFLRSEAARAKYILRASYQKPVSQRWPYRLLHLLENVDPPTPAWQIARNQEVDMIKIEAAVHHPSQWIVWMAANLLEHCLDEPSLEACVERLYREGEGFALAAGAGIAGELRPQSRITLTMSQLARPLRRGSQYLFNGLIKWRALLTRELMSVLETGLFAVEVESACAAADLVEHLAERDPDSFTAMGATNIIDRSWQHWLAHEKPYPTGSGAIPRSPRATLARALILLGEEDKVLTLSRSDSRSDVKDVGKAQFRKVIIASSEAFDGFLAEIESAKLSPHELGEVLRDKPDLSGEQIDRIEQMLRSPSDRLRFNAMAILNDHYLSAEAITAHADRLHLDSNRQVSERAARLRR
ncbi:NACHT domain-containing NTPase [Novosphingobium sp. CECT 9465]|uniref:NACHT domain-containing protein n=1 Tax=Novosphingobium sp. CECT 9465 TaxID=2829794 RepID=UPI001E624D70|nr:hypothetical protein [Novosphingobium sp. CECT 9465]CAH0496010.1 hypothetical protein NVSP9465_01035 [Novosphingobium sp. CECT 9465]